MLVLDAMQTEFDTATSGVGVLLDASQVVPLVTEWGWFSHPSPTLRLFIVRRDEPQRETMEGVLKHHEPQLLFLSITGRTLRVTLDGCATCRGTSVPARGCRRILLLEWADGYKWTIVEPQAR
jgi:hypothetical protein